MFKQICVLVVLGVFYFQNLTPREHTKLRSFTETFIQKNKHSLPTIGIEHLQFEAYKIPTTVSQSGVTTRVHTIANETKEITMIIGDNESSYYIQSTMYVRLRKVQTGTNIVTTTEILGTEPCHCGIFICYKCPIINERVDNVAVYEEHSLTLEDYKGLYTFMAEQLLELQKLESITFDTLQIESK